MPEVKTLKLKFKCMLKKADGPGSFRFGSLMSCVANADNIASNSVQKTVLQYMKYCKLNTAYGLVSDI